MTSCSVTANADLVHRQRGFTLLEILVVVAIVALCAAVIIPNVSVTGEQALEKDAAQVTDLVAVLSEHSLFSGELVGLYLSDERLMPLRFDPDEQKFMPFSSDRRNGIAPLTLDGSVRLEWQLVEPGSRDDERRHDSAPSEQGLSLADAAEARLTTGEKREDKRERPQLYFFPSGESTAATLMLREVGQSEMPLKLKLDTFGRITREPSA